jgi:hypothetical protein
MGRHTVAGTATRYGLDGPGIKSPWRRYNRNHPDRHWAYPSACTMGIGCLFETYRRRGMALPPTHLVSRLMKEYRYLYFLLGPHGQFLKIAFYLEVNNHTVHGAVWETSCIYCDNHTQKIHTLCG